jgi:fimbrial chaperone protein
MKISSTEIIDHFNRFILTRFILGTILGLFLISLNAYAGVFSVTPVRIYMEPKDRAVAVTITNDGDEPLVMQADLYTWKQKPNGEDELILTEDMFLSPPIIKLAPNSRQVVRLARLTPAKSGEQLTYRMIVREIPEAKSAKKDLQLQIALAFSMPVFITPPDVKPRLVCKLGAGSLIVVCENTGKAHVHPTQINLEAKDGTLIAIEDSGAYLLPGSKRSFQLKPSEKTKASAGQLPTGKARIAVVLDDASKHEYDVSIAN